jgi:hypothetical protein
MTTIILRTDDNKSFAIAHLQKLPVNREKPIWMVRVEPYKDKRSLEQNSLLHKWLQEIANQTGNSLEGVKEYIRSKYLAPVIEDWKDPKTGEFKILEKPRSTTSLGVKEMTILLNHVEQEAREFGVALSYPQEYGAYQ